jgi:hypothetical protein
MIAFSTAQGELLTLNDRPSTIALTQDLLADVAELNRPLTPIDSIFTIVKRGAVSGHLSADMTGLDGGA